MNLPPFYSIARLIFKCQRSSAIVQNVFLPNFDDVINLCFASDIRIIQLFLYKILLQFLI